MASIGQILSRTFFWSYERGTWQYDVAVVLILIFVLLTPRAWFRDQPFGIAVLTPAADGIARITLFGDPSLVERFQLKGPLEQV